ncbi:hypothetical protein BS78_06G246600 [Paspalum vaginatum]|nr:hypothetical protein BS78_06G246600 [Paspalum vaginatum]
MEASKHRSRSHTMGNNRRVPPYLLLVLLAIGGAAVSVGILHKMRERRVLTVLLQERDQQLISFQLLLEKEKEINKEMRRKVDELEAKTSVLSIERAELKNKLMDSETTTTYLTNTQKELEAALVEKESHINQVKENAAASNPDQTTPKELLQQKEAELDKSENSSDSIPATAEENSNSTTASESSQQDESIVVGAHTENATSETVVLDKSENTGDSVPSPVEENSNNINASESSHQHESIEGGASNDNATSDPMVHGKSENTNDSIPSTAEEQSSYNTTASESNQQDNSSSQEQFLKLTTNMEDGQPQENKGDANEQSDDAPDGSHSDKSELPQWNQKTTDSQEVSKEPSQVVDPQDEISNHSRESKLLEKEDVNAIVKEADKEINPEGASSEDSLSEDNQNKMQVDPVANTADANPSTSTNNEERKESSKRHRRRKSRSRRKRRATVATSNIDGTHQTKVDATANP